MDAELAPHIRSVYKKTEHIKLETKKEANQNEVSQDLKLLPLFCLKSSNPAEDCLDNSIKTETKEQFPKIIDLDSAIKKDLERAHKLRIKSMSETVRFNDTLFYIYTSGTTGLPKAAIIKHSKFILASIMCKHIMGMRENDVLYTAGLPLCHTLG